MIRRPPRSTRTDHSFPTRRSSDLRTTPPMSDAIQRLYAKVTLERGGNPKTSRTAKLFADGRTKITKKLVAEASEVSQECDTNTREEVIHESVYLMSNWNRLYSKSVGSGKRRDVC